MPTHLEPHLTSGTHTVYVIFGRIMKVGSRPRAHGPEPSSRAGTTHLYI